MKTISLNFGAIKDTVYRFSSRTMVNESKSGKISILNAFMEEMRKNPLLKKQHFLFKNLEKGFCKSSSLAERYINQNLKMFEGVDYTDINRLNREVRIKLLGDAHVEGQKQNNDLYEAVNTLLKSVTHKGFTQIDEAQDAYDMIMEHLMKDKSSQEEKTDSIAESDYPKILSWKFVTELAVNNFNERYNHLTEEEKNLLKVLTSPKENKINYLIDLKNENLEDLGNLLKGEHPESISNVLKVFKEKIESIQESTMSDVDIDDAIINLADLKESLEEYKTEE